VVVLDSADRVLLLQASDPFRPASGEWWELPGGGIEQGEPSGVAAARELYEETGIDSVEMGPCVWRQHAVFDFGGYHFDQQEHVHVARGQGGEYRPAGLEALEALAFKGARWWTLAELVQHVAGGGRVLPPWLVDQLPVVLAAGWPPRTDGHWPINMGDLGNIA
jgi:8-oxo-dGTP pyrophosphatase MutT (NUDIX family)